MGDWVEEMKQEWQNDVAVLKAGWTPEKNDPGLTGVREYCANTREIVAAPVFKRYFRMGAA